MLAQEDQWKKRTKMIEQKATIDFSKYISERTRNFTGREWVFRAINDWLGDPEAPHFFLITGEPGSGKTAIASRLVQFSTGEVPLPNNLPYFKYDFLSAIHFCDSRNGRLIDPRTFAESIATQLARRYPAYKEALQEITDAQINISVVQQHNIATNITGADIKIDLSDAPESAFARVVLTPLEKLYHDDPDRQILILVDALDEALHYAGPTNILSLLSQTSGLHSGVRFILTSRRDVRVEGQIQDAKRLFISDPKFNELNEADIANYLRNRLQEDREVVAKTQGLSSDQMASLKNMIINKAEGNFLYISFLLKSLATDQQRFNELEKLPTGLDGLYYESFRKVIGLDNDKWTEGYAPLMGILCIAQEGLTQEQLQRFTGQSESAVFLNMTRLRQFTDDALVNNMNPTDRKYRLYHRSLLDFFQRQSLTIDDERIPNSFYLPPEEWHARLVDHYFAGAMSVQYVNWHQVDDYGLRHLTTHLYSLSRLEAYRQKLYDLARNRSFATAQRGRIRDSNLPMKTVQMALLASAETDEPGTMTEFLLSHAHSLFHTSSAQGSPVSILQSGNLKGAWELADLYDIQFSCLWYLLLAWKLKDLGQIKQGKETLERLPNNKRLVRFSGWEMDDFILLFTSAFEILDSNTFSSLYSQTLEEDYWFNLCQDLIANNLFDGGLQVASSIVDDWTRSDALNSIARSLLLPSAKEQAAKTLKAALEIANEIQNVAARAWAQGTLSATQYSLGQLEEAKKTFAAALENIQKTEDMEEQAIVLAAISSDQSRVGQIQEAKKSFIAALNCAEKIADIDKRVEVVGRIAPASLQGDDFETAFKIANDIVDTDRYITLLITISNAQSHFGHKQRAKETLQLAFGKVKEIKDESVRIELIKEIAAQQARSGESASALSIANEVEESYSRCSILIGIANAQSETGKKEEARDTIAIAFSIVNELEALAAAEGESELMTLKTNAFAHGLRTKLGDWSGEEVPFHGNRWSDPDFQIGSLLLEITLAQAKVGDFSSALETARRIKYPEQHVRTLSALAAIQARAGQEKDARKNFADALETEQQVNNRNVRRDARLTRSRIVARIAMEKVKIREFAAALEPAKRIEDEERQSLVFAAIAEAQARAGQIEEARKTFDVAIETAQKIKDEWIPPRRNEKSWRSIGTARVRFNPEMNTSAYALGAIAAALIRADLFDDPTTSMLVQQVIEKNFQADILSDIALAQAHFGQRGKASEKFVDALKAAQEIRDAQMRTSVMLRISEAEAQADLKEESRETLLTTLKSTQEIQDKSVQTDMLSAIAKTQASMGHFASALETVRSIADVNAALDTLISIAKVQARAGQKQEANETFSAATKIALDVKDEQARGEMLEKIAGAQAEAGDFVSAYKTAENVENPSIYVSTLKTIGEMQAEAGKKEEAQKTFECAFRMTENIESGIDRAWAQIDIAEAQVDSGLPKEALNTSLSTLQDVRKMDVDEESQFILQNIAQKCAQAGDLPLALKLVQEIVDEGFKVETLGTVAASYARSGFGEEAVHIAESIHVDKDKHLYDIISALAETKDKEHFKHMLVPCSYYLGLAYRICELLIELYPENAVAIEKAVREST
jgi:tetratricopeptide (TPR) repeat protein